jgi:hypothetical protein
MSLVLRAAKGLPLTHQELDGNQTFLASRLAVWSSEHEYTAGEFCTHSNQIWRALTTSLNRPPSSSPADWVAYFTSHSHTNIGDISTLVSNDATMAANSTSLLPTQRAVKTYVDAAISGGVGSYTDEQAQDAAANILLAGNPDGDLTWTYNDAGNSISAVLKTFSIVNNKLADNAVTGDKIASNAVTVSKMSILNAQAMVGALAGSEGLGSTTTVLVSNNPAAIISGLEIRKVPLLTGPTYLKLVDMEGPGIMGTEATGVPGRLILGSNLGISSGTLNVNVGATARLLGRFGADAGPVQEITIGSGLSLSVGGALSADAGGYTFTSTNKLYGRASAGGGIGEEITLGTNLSFTGTTLNAASGSYSFTNTTRLYGRSTAGSGPGEEISIGSGLSLVAGTLSATGGGGGGATVTISDTAPVTPAPTDLWWSSDDLSLRIYYDDGTTSQWVDASPISSGYTFTNTTRLYGRSTAGSGLGEEIVIGSGLSLAGGTLSASGGGGGSIPGILGYETTGAAFRSSISCSDNSDPNQAASSFINTAFIGNNLLVADSASNDVAFGLFASSYDIQAPLAGAYLAMLGTTSSRISTAYSSVILAADNATLHDPISGTSLGNSPNCAIVHGIDVAGSTCSRTFNYGTQEWPKPITSFNVDNSDYTGADGMAVIESTLFSVHNGFSSAKFLSNASGNIHDLLKGSCTTMAPFFWYIFATVLAVSENGSKAAVWEVKALVKGTGVNTCSIIGSTVTKIFNTTPDFASDVVPSLTTSGYDNPYEVPSSTLSLVGRGESGTSTSYYAYVRIQRLIRTAA